MRRDDLGDRQELVDDPRLAADLGRDPARERRDPARERHRRQRAQDPRLRLTPAAQRPRREPRDGDHEKPHADHDAKREEDDGDGRMRAFELVEPADLAVGIVRQDQARAARDLEREARLAPLLVGPAEHRERHAAVRFPDGLDRRDLRGLVLERVQAVQIAEHGLQRREHGREIDARLQHERRRGAVDAPDHAPGADARDQECCRQQRGRRHVREAVRERRVEDHGEPVDGVERAVDDLVTLRRLHPRVQAQDPERRQRRADCDERRRDEMHAVRHAVLAEQHDREERRLDEERRQHLVAEQRPADVAGALDEAGPVRAELKAHRDARHDAERERQREDLDPEVIGVLPRLVARGREPDAEEEQQPREPDRDRRK